MVRATTVARSEAACTETPASGEVRSSTASTKASTSAPGSKSTSTKLKKLGCPALAARAGLACMNKSASLLSRSTTSSGPGCVMPTTRRWCTVHTSVTKASCCSKVAVPSNTPCP